jgi:predicted phosphate transport protein (TIGR00153 family)
LLTPTDLLREPPFGLLVEHMELTVEAARSLAEMFAALAARDSAGANALGQRVVELEDQADQIKNTIRDQLPHNMKLSVSRRDLLTMVSAQDTITDNALRIVWLLELRPLEVPADMAEPLAQLAQQVQNLVGWGKSLAVEVQVLAESNFSGPHLEEAQKIIAEIDAQEMRCDEQAHDLLRRMLSLEGELGPVNVMLWFRVIELINSLADATKKLSNRVRLLLAK